MNFKSIVRENIPCWYELGWRMKKPAIILRVHKDFLSGVKLVSEKAPIVETLKESFQFKSFVGNFEGNFGFDNAFIRTGDKENFVEFVIKIPKVKKLTNRKCDRCGGSGKDPDFGRECLSCKGTGKKHIFNWKPAYAISASFSIFTLLTQFPQIETSASSPQLLVVKTITGKDMNGAGLGSEYSIPLVKWLSSLFPATRHISEMVQAMKVAYNRMLGLEKFDQFSFDASVDHKSGWLNVDCPGDACGLNPANNAGYNMEKGRGYEFYCHNVDSPAQQITLLAGLAAMCDKARQEIQIIE